MLTAMLDVPGSNTAEVRVTADAVEGKLPIAYVERITEKTDKQPPAEDADEGEAEDEELMARSA